MQFKQLFKWAAIVVICLGIFYVFASADKAQQQQQQQYATLTYSELLTALEQQPASIAEIDTTNGSNKVLVQRSGKGLAPAVVVLPEPFGQNAMLQAADKAHVKVVAHENENTAGTLLSWVPTLLMIGFFVYLLRSMRGGGLGGFGKSKHKLIVEEKGKATFADVAGVDEAKAELQEIVDYLKDPARFQRLGGRVPRGVLLVGPPGTGKTLLARAVAGEANRPFLTISGSDFVEMFVGVGASRVRDMFAQAKKNAPCIVFIDEIDALGRQRGAGIGGGNDEREQTLNQLLVEMDGFTANEGVILIAATNRPDVLDQALLRPGRFDRQVVVGRPDQVGRLQILQVHAKKVPLAADVDLNVVARGTPGMTGADLANLINEAALLATRRNKQNVDATDLEDARDKLIMGGPERRSLVMSQEEQELTAWHEAGHAIVMLYADGHEPLHKVTRIPRGPALGVTMWLPERDKLSQSFKQCMAKMSSLYGGVIAEELKFGEDGVTSGASSDIAEATKLARLMVTEWGYSKRLGRVRYATNQQEIFLARSVSENRQMSDKTAEVIDEEVQAFTEKGEANAKRILSEHFNELAAVARALLKDETLTGDQVKALCKQVQAGAAEQSQSPSPPAHQPEQSPLAMPEAGTTGGAQAADLDDTEHLPSDRSALDTGEPQAHQPENR